MKRVERGYVSVLVRTQCLFSQNPGCILSFIFAKMASRCDEISENISLILHYYQNINMVFFI